MSWIPHSQRRAVAVTGAIMCAALVLAALAMIAPHNGSASFRRSEIAFTSNREGSVDLYVTARNSGLPPRRLTNDQAVDGDPAWSPDGSRIVFASERDGNVDLYVIDADSGELERLTDHPAADLHPAWSPDGRRIAFTSERYDDIQPDYDGNAEILVLDLDTRRISRLTHHPADDAFPTWSPDGDRIAFASQRSGTFNLYVVNASGGDPSAITHNTGTSWQPAWEPDGDRIAFAYVPSGFTQNEVAWISLVDADGAGLVRLTRELRGDFDPSWSTDGQRLVFVSTRAGSRELYTMEVGSAAGAARVDAGAGNASDPAWRPR